MVQIQLEFRYVLNQATSLRRKPACSYGWRSAAACGDSAINAQLLRKTTL